MNKIYAKILNGVVINTQVCSPSDVFDPAFIWIDVTNVVCSDGSGVQIGCSYDGQSFFPAQSAESAGV